MLTLPPGRGNLLGLLWSNERAQFGITRQKQNGALNVLNRFVPRSALWHKRNDVEHVQIELCLGLQVGHQFFFGPFKCAWGQETMGSSNAFYRCLGSECLVP